MNWHDEPALPPKRNKISEEEEKRDTPTIDTRPVPFADRPVMSNLKPSAVVMTAEGAAATGGAGVGAGAAAGAETAVDTTAAVDLGASTGFRKYYSCDNRTRKRIAPWRPWRQRAKAQPLAHRERPSKVKSLKILQIAD